jgi:acetoin utilization protein AcuB
MPGRTVGEGMTSDVVTLLESDTLRAAVELELSRHIRHIPVLDGRGAVVGIVTDRDIKRILPSPLAPPAPEVYESLLDATLVSRVMTREPYTIDVATPVAAAVRIILERKVGGLPVVKDGVLVGMFTQSDALRSYLQLLDGEADH